MKNTLPIIALSLTIAACGNNPPKPEVVPATSPAEPTQQVETPQHNQNPIEKEDGSIVIATHNNEVTEWKLGRDEHNQIFNVLYNTDKSAAFLIGCGRLVEGHWVQKMFEDTSNYHQGKVAGAITAVNFNGKTIPLHELHLPANVDHPNYGDGGRYGKHVFYAGSFEEYGQYDMAEVNKYIQLNLQKWATGNLFINVDGVELKFTLPNSVPKCVPGQPGVGGALWNPDNL